MKQSLWLVMLLTQRELSQRYRGTVLGALWPFLYAALLLGIFTFVFSLVLKVRWSPIYALRPSEGALMIFAGLVPYLFFADVLTRSTTSITSVPNFVKKVRFPLPILPIVVVNSALSIAAINALILVITVALLWRDVPATALMLPLLFVPLAAFGLGLAYLFGALGVFFRDLSHISPLLAQLMMFLAPICYPASAIPPAFSHAIDLNPITWFVTTFRDITLEGRSLLVSDWVTHTFAYLVFALFTFAFFHRTQRSFADLL